MPSPDDPKVAENDIADVVESPSDLARLLVHWPHPESDIDTAENVSGPHIESGKPRATLERRGKGPGRHGGGGAYRVSKNATAMGGHRLPFNRLSLSHDVVRPYMTGTA